MKLYDCCMYFDEDLMLDLRLNTLNEHVDKFIIAEATRDHSGKEKKLNFEHIGRGAIWSDAGKIDDMTNISTFVKSVENVENIKIACLEEIALSKKWINKKTILKNIKFYGNCEYSNYLKKL